MRTLDLDEDLAEWERGELSSDELTARHPRENSAEILALYASLISLTETPTPDLGSGWAALSERLSREEEEEEATNDPSARWPIRRAMAVAAVVVVLGAGVAFASEPVRDRAQAVLGGVVRFLAGQPAPAPAVPHGGEQAVLFADNVRIHLREDTATGWVPSLRNWNGHGADCVVVSQPRHGTAWVSRNCRSGGYVPPRDFHGMDYFTYAAWDSDANRYVAAVVLTVAPVNDRPVGRSDAETINEDEGTTISVLTNDSDPDGDPLRVASVTSGSNGSVRIEGTNVVYQPDRNFNGADSFTYSVSDGKAKPVAARVSVTVLAVNDAPVAGDDAATTDEGTAVTIRVLLNDSDPDGDPLTVAPVTQGSSGVVSVGQDGTLVYQPNQGFSGVDSFTYSVSDGTGEPALATVTVTVMPAAGPPGEGSPPPGDGDAGGHGPGPDPTPSPSPS